MASTWFSAPGLLRVAVLGVSVLVLLQAAVAGAAPRVAPGLAARASSEGRVPVIVQLATPFVPEGRLAAAGAAAQRAAMGGARQQALAAVAPHAHGLRRTYRSIPFLALEVGPAALAALEASPWVISVAEDRARSFTLEDSVPLIDADTVQALGLSGVGYAIAVIDTGVDGAHPNLAGKVVGEACFTSDQSAPGPNVGDCPNGEKSQFGAGAGVACNTHVLCSHGTHVAGIATAAVGPNFPGVAPQADVISIRVSTLVTNPSQCGVNPVPCLVALDSDVLAGLDEVYDSFRFSHDVAAVNISLGSQVFTSTCDATLPAFKAAIDNLRSVGIPTVIAAGNDGVTNGISAPACISSAVSVSASGDIPVGVPPWTNYAPFVSLWAPGRTIFAPEYFTTGYFKLTGTSMAAPHVSGAWALLREGAPGASLDDIFDALQDTGLYMDETPGGATRIVVSAAFDELTIACANGVDDDGDGLVDFAGGDPGCDDAADDSEKSALLPCDDGLDDDGDTFVDYIADGDSDGISDPPGDPACKNPSWASESAVCQDGIDNDGKFGTDWDGGVSAGQPADPDGLDPQCNGKPWHHQEQSGGGHCGLGGELVLLAPLLRLRRRRRA